jgi:hypothetical protein
MSNRLYLPTVLILLVCLAGCQKELVRPEIKNTEVINAPFDDVWRSTIEVISDLPGLPIETIEKESGLITTQMTNININDINEWAVKPSIFLGIWAGGRCKISVYTAPVNESTTKLKISTHFEALESYMTKSWHTCYSNGKLEEKLLGLIKAKLIPITDS